MIKIFVYRCTSCNKTVESKVELEECPHCGFDARWDTWNEVQIIEKEEKNQGEQNMNVVFFDGDIVPKHIVNGLKSLEKNEKEKEKIIGWQDKVIEPREKMMKKDIIKKVKKIEKKKTYILRCLKAKVCPGCGRSISSDTTIGAYFTCRCGFERAVHDNQ